MFRPHKNIIPYLHAGHVKILDGSWGTGLGVMVPIHLNSRLTIVPDVKATGYSSRTYGAADNNVALTLSATVGIAVNLGKARKSPEAAPAPVVVSEPERIAQPQPYQGGRDTVIIREYYREVVVRDTVYVTPEVGHPDTVGAMALFDTDSDVIRPEAYPDLDKVAEWFQKHPKAHATIEGHTDSTASAQYNQGLSERRAMAVYMYLVRKGISPNRLTFVGYGLTRPIDTNATETGRQRNRRVEIKVEE